jgi:hypothetical protein
MHGMKSYIIGLIFIAATFSACVRENVAAKLREATHQQLQGEWKVGRIVTELFEPIPTLSERTEYRGKSSDYYRFGKNQLVDITSPLPGQSQQEGYEVVNPNQLIIGKEVWWIKNLTGTTLQLVQDRNYVEQNRRYVTSIYLCQ